MAAITESMDWGVVAVQEGSEITPLTCEEMEEVAGGWVQFVAWGAGIAIGMAIAYITRKK